MPAMMWTITATMRTRIGQIVRQIMVAVGTTSWVPAVVAVLLIAGWVTWSFIANDHFGFGWMLELPLHEGVALVMSLAVLLAYSTRGARTGLLPDPRPMNRRLELAILGVVLAVGAGLRVYALDRFPRTLDLDTAQNGYVAMQLWTELTQGSYTAILDRWAPGNETMLFYLQGLTMRLLGVSVEALRLPSALIGVLTLYLIYRLGREQISARVGLAAALMSALSPWHLDLSRSAKRSVLIPLFVCLVLIFLCRALRRAPSARAALDLALCGLMLGLGLHSYELFRVAPLAVAGAIIWVRLAQRRSLWQGPAEVALTLGVATLVALPIIITALAAPEVYFHHTAHASLLETAVTDGAIKPLLLNGGAALAHALDHIPLGTGWVDLRGAPVAASVLFLVGLFSMFSLRAGAGEGEGDHRPRVWTVAVGSMLAIMVAVLLLTKVHHAPRRYTGLMVPLFLLAGGAGVGILQLATHRLGAKVTALLTVAAAVGLATPIPKVFALMGTYQEDFSQARAEAIIRWAAARSDTREVYLSAGILDNHYLTHFMLLKPGLRQLASGLPLPGGPLKGKVMLVADAEEWGATLTPLVRFRERTVELALPDKVLGDEVIKDPRLKIKVYELSGPDLASYRIPTEHIKIRFDGALLTGESGSYGFRLSPGATGQLTLGSTSLELNGEEEHKVSLTSGLTPVIYRGGKARAPLQWRPPGAETWSPLPLSLLWKLPADVLPIAAPPEEEGWISDGAPPEVVSLEASAEDDLHTIQDMDHYQGEAHILDTNLNSLSRLASSKAKGSRLSLWFGKGDLFGDSYYHSNERRSAYQQQYPAFKLAVSGRGIYLLDRLRGAAFRFHTDGNRLGKLRGPFSWPLDLAADEEVVYVADHGRRAILGCDPSGASPAVELIRGIVPTSVSVLDGALAYTDRATHQVVVVLLDSLKVETRTTLQAVTDTTGVTLLPDGIVMVTQPKRQRIFMVSRRGGGLSVNGDPGALNHPTPVFSPRGGFRLPGGKELLVLGENELMRVPLYHVGEESP